MIFEIPIDCTYPYFIQTTSFENVAYQLEFVWNDRDERWRISFLDMQDNVILRNLKIVPVLPMTQRYRIQSFLSGDIIGIDTKTTTNMPTRTNLGADFKLFYLSQDELKSYNMDKLV